MDIYPNMNEWVNYIGGMGKLDSNGESAGCSLLVEVSSVELD